MTKLNEKFKTEFPALAEIHIRLQEYVEDDLRKKFDAAKSAIQQIHIIDEAREFGIDATEMIDDFCSEDDCKSLWKIHEDRVVAEINGDRLFQLHHENS